MSILDKLGLQNKINFDDWYNRFLSLEKNQQIAVSVGAGMALVILLAMPVGCVSSRLSEKESDYQRQLKMASDFNGVLSEYKRLKNQFNTVKKRSSKLGRDPLKGVIYNITDELNIQRQKVTPKTVSPVTAELFTELAKDVTIKNIRFDQAILLLGKLVKYDKIPVKIKKLSIKVDPNNKQNMRTMTFTVSTMRPNK